MTDVIHKVLMISLLMNGRSLLVVTLIQGCQGVALGADSEQLLLHLLLVRLQCQFQSQ
jgi:hypothetical protein